MNTSVIFFRKIWMPLLLVTALLLWGGSVQAKIDGVTVTDGQTLNFTAQTGYITTSDGDSFQMWLYGMGGGPQYPGPTLIMNEGDTITIQLTNSLPAQAGNTSIVFPGHKAAASGGQEGLLTREAPRNGTVSYTFTAGQPGTYLYRSGSRPDLQIEMGLIGAIIVRPSMGSSFGYNHADTRFDREYLYLITEMDPTLHRYVESNQMNRVDTSQYFATNWFINGRNFPDLMSDAGVPWLPTQPYNCQPRMHPGETVLIRLIGAGVEGHPMHLHGNDFDTIAADGRMLSSGAGAGPDLAWKATTIRTVPGQTADVLWTWTGEGLGWDIYGHAPGDPMEPGEKAEFHGVEFPVILPTRDTQTYGQFYSGSPFLGGEGDLAPGDAGLNSTGGYFYMWHSHTEKELTSNDIWPGGLVSFMIVEHPSVNIIE